MAATTMHEEMSNEELWERLQSLKAKEAELAAEKAAQEQAAAAKAVKAKKQPAKATTAAEEPAKETGVAIDTIKFPPPFSSWFPAFMMLCSQYSNLGKLGFVTAVAALMATCYYGQYLVRWMERRARSWMGTDTASESAEKEAAKSGKDVAKGSSKKKK